MGRRRVGDGSATLVVTALALMLALMLVSGCGGSPQEPTSASQDDASCSLSEPTIRSLPRSARVPTARTVEELLPNRLFEVSEGRFESVSASVVVGEPTAVRPGAAYDWSDMTGDETSSRVDFSDPDAETRTWLVTLAVHEVLGGVDPVHDGSADEVTVSLTSSGALADGEALAARVEALGRSVWFLSGVDDGGDVLRVPWDGGAVAAVGVDGNLSFPFLPEARVDGSWPDSLRLDCLRALAAQPDQQVPSNR